MLAKTISAKEVEVDISVQLVGKCAALDRHRDWRTREEHVGMVVVGVHQTGGQIPKRHRTYGASILGRDSERRRILMLLLNGKDQLLRRRRLYSGGRKASPLEKPTTELLPCLHKIVPTENKIAFFSSFGHDCGQIVHVGNLFSDRVHHRIEQRPNFQLDVDDGACQSETTASQLEYFGVLRARCPNSPMIRMNELD